MDAPHVHFLLRRDPSNRTTCDLTPRPWNPLPLPAVSWSLRLVYDVVVASLEANASVLFVAGMFFLRRFFFCLSVPPLLCSTKSLLHYFALCACVLVSLCAACWVLGAFAFAF